MSAGISTRPIRCAICLLPSLMSNRSSTNHAFLISGSLSISRIPKLPSLLFTTSKVKVAPAAVGNSLTVRLHRGRRVDGCADNNVVEQHGFHGVHAQALHNAKCCAFTRGGRTGEIDDEFVESPVGGDEGRHRLRSICKHGDI